VKKYILIRSRYNAVGLGVLFFLIVIVAFLRKGDEYFRYVFPMFAVYIFIFNRSTRKYRPKRVQVPVMETERTFFTVLTVDDLPAMSAMARERDTFRFIKKLRVLDEEEYQAFLWKKLEQIRLKSGFHWAVWLKKNNKFIGAVNLNPIAGSGRLQVGCQLKRRYWRQGYASELTRRVVEFAIGEAGLTEVYGVFEKDNAASRRLMEKLGFTLLEKRTELEVELEVHRYVVD
jgi:ribosomal-protein-alanine N-acetyltransferase